MDRILLDSTCSYVVVAESPNAETTAGQTAPCDEDDYEAIARRG